MDNNNLTITFNKPTWLVDDEELLTLIDSWPIWDQGAETFRKVAEAHMRNFLRYEELPKYFHDEDLTVDLCFYKRDVHENGTNHRHNLLVCDVTHIHGCGTYDCSVPDPRSICDYDENKQYRK